MKKLTLLMTLLMLLNCKEKPQSDESPNLPDTQYSFYLGTYTDGDSQGIYKYGLTAEGKFVDQGLMAKTDNPSYLAKNTSGNILLAVNETDIEGSGSITAFSIEQDSLQFVNQRATGGAHPCHVSVTDDNLVLVSNYTGGNLSLFKLEDRVGLSDRLDLKQHTGKGITDRQEAPHVHFAKSIQKDQIVVASDLGTNELWFYSIDSTKTRLSTYEQTKLKMNDGGGPRHWALHPNGQWLFVLNELNSEVQLVHIRENGLFEAAMVTSILPVDFKEGNTGADIHITLDGRFLYASNRGHNSIAILEIEPETGKLELIGHESTKGDGPRNFSFSPDENFLIVANQRTNNLVSFKRNKETGMLTLADEIAAPTPVCILF